MAELSTGHAYRPEPGSLSLSGEQLRQTLAELEAILSSPQFRNSKRCQAFLQFVVLERLADRSEALKERVLGMEVFGRPADYDTNDDAIVRVTANEVRKRLAQRYQGLADSWRVRITLPPGSYVPGIDFRATDAGAAAQDPAVEACVSTQPEHAPPETAGPDHWRPEVEGWSLRRKGLAAASLLTVIALGYLLIHSADSSSHFETFWSPFWQSNSATLVCMANPIVYLPSSTFSDRYRRTRNRTYRIEPAPMDLSNETMTGADWIADVDQHVGIGDMFAASRILMLLAEKGKRAELRISRETSFTDLRRSNSILIGAYSNYWSLNANQHQRFVFGDRKIFDRLDPAREWVISTVYPDKRQTEDLALVGRSIDSHTGKPVITAAGIGHFGTAAAGEFLASPELLDAALQRLPGDWKNKSLQFVLHTTVIGTTSGPVKVVASAMW